MAEWHTPYRANCMCPGGDFVMTGHAFDLLVIGNTTKRNRTVMGDCKTAECDPTIGESAMIQPIRLDHGG